MKRLLFTFFCAVILIGNVKINHKIDIDNSDISASGFYSQGITGGNFYGTILLKDENIVINSEKDRPMLVLKDGNITPSEQFDITYDNGVLQVVPSSETV